MYPDLSYFFNDLFGTEVDNWTSIFKTFGFMLVVALAACGILLKSELQRKEKEGLILPQKVSVVTSEKLSIQDILINSLFSLFIGAKIPMLIMNFELLNLKCSLECMLWSGLNVILYYTNDSVLPDVLFIILLEVELAANPSTEFTPV
jgi:hypothetical protein